MFVVVVVRHNTRATFSTHVLFMTFFVGLVRNNNNKKLYYVINNYFHDGKRGETLVWCDCVTF